MIKYRKTFLDIIKLLLLYFMEFCNNRSILLKIYSKNYIGGKLNQKPIIMILNNENTFFANDNW